MGHWYLAKCMGKPELWLDTFRLAAENRLEGTILRLRIEKGVSKRATEFYAAVELTEKIGDSSNEILKAAGFYNHSPVAAEEITGGWMADAEQIDFREIIRIPYRSPATRERDTDEEIDPDTRLGPDETLMFERLATWVSAAGRGSCDQVSNAIACIWPGERKIPLWVALRNLQLLGIVEVSPDGKTWRALPTTFYDGGNGVAVLGGARTILWDRSIEESGGSFECQPKRDGVRRVLVRCDFAEEELKANRTQCASLVENLESILLAADVTETLKLQREEIRPHAYTIETDELAQDQRIEADEEGNPAAPGIYRLSHRTSGRFPITRFFDGESWYRGATTSLNYALRRMRQDPWEPVAWEAEEGEMVIMKSDRLPIPIERILVQSTGFLPADEDDTLIYQGLPAPLVETLLRHIGNGTTGYV